MKQRAARGVRWSTFENAGVRIMTLAAFLVLARLLDKEAFGVVALALAYVAFLELLVRVGFLEVIVQKKELSEADKDTAFWASMALGMVALSLSWLLAPVAAGWSDSPDLEAVLKWLAIGIIPLALTRVQQGILTRDMRFRSLAIRRLAGAGSGAAVGVGCALAGMGVWSLVAQQLTARLVDFLTLYWVTKWYPSLRFSLASLRSMLPFGWKILGISSVQFGSTQADRFLIGHFLGVGALGIYVVGRRIVEVLLGMMSSVIGRVAFSAFAKFQDEEKRLARASRSVAQLTAALAFPCLVFVALAGKEINLLLFGEKWLEAGFIVQLAAAAGAVRVMAIIAGPLCKARGMPGRVLVATGLQALASIALCVGLSPLGFEAMVAGWLVGEVIGALVLLRMVDATRALSWKDVLRIYRGPMLASLGGAALLLASTFVITLYDGGLAFVLAANVAAFAIGYLLCLRLVSPDIYQVTIKDGIALISGRGRSSPTGGQ